MPFANIGPGWVYFAHVPKCAGSSVEDYLERRFGQTLGFRDGQFLKVPEAERWTKSSPQHIPAAALARLIPPEMFVAQFAVVRHPLTRLQSVYRFQKVWQETIPAELSFSAWLATLEGALAAEPFYLDNHVRPMTDLVPEGARVFRIEDGTTPIIAWLDRLVGDAEGPRAFRHMKSHKLIHERKGVPVQPITPTPADIALIAALYAADFARFGYTPDHVPIPAAHRARSAAGGVGHNLTQGEA
jgi:hypothetical protein